LRLQNKLILALLLTFLGSFALVELIDYQRTRAHVMSVVRDEAYTIRSVLMATRRVYHQQFLDSGLPLTPQTIGFLPAHALSRISADFSSWEKDGLFFNNVSDQARNPANRADAVEIQAMNFFRSHPQEADHLVYIQDSTDPFYHFSTPIWVEAYCLKCHGKSADAPPTIRSSYDAGYDYQVGDLRGILSIKIPARLVKAQVHGNLLSNMWLHLLGFLLAAGVLSLLLQRSILLPVSGLRKAIGSLSRGRFDENLSLGGDDEISEVTGAFSSMAKEIKLRQDALTQSEIKLRQMVDSMPDGVALVSGDGLIQQANSAFGRLFDKDEISLVGDHISDYLPCGRDSSLMLQSALVEPLEQNLTLPKSDGRQIEVELQLRSLVEDTDNSSAYLLILRDRTERQETEQAFQAMVNSLVGSFGQNCLDRIVAELTKWFKADMVLLGKLCPDGTLRSLAMQLDGSAKEGAVYPMDNSPCEEALEHGFYFCPENLQEFFPGNQDLVEFGAESYAGARLVDSEGEYLGVLAVTSRRPMVMPYKGEEVLTLVAARAAAVIQRMAVESQLARSEARFRKYFEQGLIGMAVTSVDKGWIEVNERLCEIFGYSREELFTKTWAEITHPDDLDKNLEFFDPLLKGEKEGYQLEKRYIRKNGEIVPTILSVSALREASGRVESVLAFVQDISEQKQAEKALQESEDYYRRFFETAPLAYDSFDAEGHIIEVNQAWLDMFGYSRNEVIGKSLAEFLPPHHQASFYSEWPVWTAMGAIYGKEIEIVKKDGSLLPVVGHSRVIRDKNGEFLRTNGILMDRSEQKLIKDRLSQMVEGLSVPSGEEFFPQVVSHLASALKVAYASVSEQLENNPDRLRTIAFSRHGVIVPSIEKDITGTPFQEVRQRNRCIVCSDNVRLRFPNDVLAGELGIESFAAVPLCSSSGQLLGYLAVSDTHPMKDPPYVESVLKIFAMRVASELERRNFEQTLSQSEKRYRGLSQQFQTVLDGIPDSLSLVGPDYRIIWANQGTARLLHMEQEDLTGRHCFELWQDRAEPCESCPMQRSFETGETQDAKVTTFDGRVWGVKSFPQKDRAGKVTGVINYASDITERMKLRDESARSSRLAALGELAAGVAHEINNPNGVVLLNTPILEKTFAGALPILDEYYREHGNFPLGDWHYAELREEIPQMLDEMLDGANRIKRIVDDLKDFVRQEPQEFDEKFDLNVAVQTALRLCGNVIRRTTDHVETSLDETLPPVAGQIQKIEQVVVNLIMNACHALTEKGQGLFIATRFDAKERANIVEVRDEGAGIDPAHLKKLTNPFFTTKREQGGTGLGLSVSARIIKEHGGHLQFSSTPGQGTTATVILPVPQEPDNE